MMKTDKPAASYVKVGRRPDEVTLKPDGDQLWHRWRPPFSRRHWLAWRGRYNPRSLRRERRLVDKRPLWWTLGLGGLLIAVPFLSDQFVNIAAIFCIFAAINVIWTLIVGAAGIFSLATMAVVGLSAYAAAAANVYLGLPWPLMMPIGAAVGLIFGLLLALPSTRLDGLYYALLTLGIAEICRVSISQIKALAPSNSSINGVDSFIPSAWHLQRPGLLLGFAGAFVLLLCALLVFRLVNTERLGLLLQTAREDEAFAEAVGIDYRRARWLVFVLASSALGAIGAFYAMFYRSISLAVFSLDQLLLLFAMIVIGGLGRSEGAVLGTAIVVLIDKGLIGLGPLRIIIVTAVMIIVALTAREGLTGIKAQFQAFRNRKKSERRAARTEKGGEVMPEEATEIADKQLIYRRLFDKRLRDALKSSITPDLIAEHRAKPLGQHSDALDRLLNYFRREEMPDKYAILRVGPLRSCSYRVMALSGRAGHPPRLVDDKLYPTLDEAYHAVFLLRINDLLAS
ncbi:branched-chain amino acid ABC transporter permease [Bradyrhizobium sp. HKCCYLS3077]|uniref:branched-chain amino acid ABC transporter permease n=1 Tax=unclassified Bradyrhizobium TaxID=2631580 RepID=UPI003EB7004E